MPIFNKPSQGLVYDFINAANPTLPSPLTPSNTKLGSPTATTVPGRPELNTTINVLATGGEYLGRKPVNYRRLALATLFKGMTVQINKFSANQDTASSVVFTLYNLLQVINQQYGINLTTDDVNDVNITRGNTQEGSFYTSTVTVTAKASSLGYVGSFQLKWRSDAQDIAAMITVTELTGRKFPGGNDFVTPGHPVVVNNMAYGIDWSTFITGGTTWIGYPNAINTIGANSVEFFDRFINELNRLYGTNLAKGSDPTPTNAYQSWPTRLVDLSTTDGKLAAPEANAEYYNRVLIVDVPAAATLAGSGVGSHYIHYNV